MALGGGCEILLHSDAVQAHAETYIGLVECGVGLMPGWGGCKEMLTRWRTEGEIAERPDAGAGKSVRDGQHRDRLEIGGRGEGTAVPAARPTASR